MAQAPYLPFIPNAFLENEVTKLLSSAAAAISPAVKLTRNTLDPFGIIFEMPGFGLTNFADWEINEKQRQAQKTVQNCIGTFHQNILGNIHHQGNKISNNLILGHSSGLDIEVPSKLIIADIKNKFNTLNAKAKLAAYDAMHALVSPRVSTYHTYTSYYVEIISTKVVKSFTTGRDFTPSDASSKTRRANHSKIKQISGKNFYALVTGYPNALDLLYAALPAVISNVSVPTYSFSTADIATINKYFQKACS